VKYKDKLRDPRWQKKRLEILERDGNKCLECGRTNLELHVHHKKYTGEPWEANNEDMQTVCHKCHSIIHFDCDFTAFRDVLRKKYGVFQ